MTTKPPSDIIPDIVADSNLDDELISKIEELSAANSEIKDDFSKLINDVLDALDDHIEKLRSSFIEKSSSDNEEDRNTAKIGLMNLEMLDDPTSIIQDFKSLEMSKTISLDSEFLLKTNIDKLRRLARRTQIKGLKLKDFERKLLKYKRDDALRKSIMIYINVLVTTLFNHEKYKSNLKDYDLFMILMIRLMGVSLSLKIRLKAVTQVCNEVA
jgi:hypothetical protein